MSKKDEALKLALEGLEKWHFDKDPRGADQYITAIREALAEQPAQQDEYGYAKRLAEWLWQKHYAKDAPDWVPFDNLAGVLTQIDNMVCRLVKEQPAPVAEPVAYSYTSRITGAQGFSHHPMPRFIDADSWNIKPLYTAKHPIIPAGWKLVPVEPTPEMLKAMDECSTEGYDERLLAGHAWSVYTAAIDATPEAIAPPRKPWVGLTDEEIHKMTVLMGINPEWKAEMEIVRSVVRNLEAKLWEKNA